MKEIWKDIKGYKGIYQISNFGRIKTRERYIKCRGNSKRLKREKILKGSMCFGYPSIALYNNYVVQAKFVHHLVWDYFGERKGKRNLQIDHIDGDRKNNNIMNLQLLTHRGNTSKGFKDRGRELPTGVHYYYKYSKKVRARIYINGKEEHLGIYINPELASRAYQKALKQIGE